MCTYLAHISLVPGGIGPFHPPTDRVRLSPMVLTAMSGRSHSEVFVATERTYSVPPLTLVPMAFDRIWLKAMLTDEIGTKR